jgi:magnesium-transporting ATPase (P-type)
MMSVLCSRNQLHVLFSKGAPESIISKCTTILCNGDGSVMPLTADIRAELDSKFNRLGFYYLSCYLHPLSPSLSLSLCLPPLLFLYISLSLSMFSLGFTFLPYSGHSGSESRSETKLLNKNRLTYKFLNMILSINIIRHLISQSDLTS